MRTIEINICEFDELSPRAQERARDWWREGCTHDEWWDCIYEDAASIGCKITGFDLGRAQQCDLELENTMGEVAAAIIAQHGKDCDTYKLAQGYYHDRHHYSGREPYSHMPHMDVEYFAQQLSECYRFMLEAEYEHQMSDETVDENIRANGYEFTEEGELAA